MDRPDAPLIPGIAPPPAAPDSHISGDATVSFALIAAPSTVEPVSYEEAMNRPDSDKWLKAAQEEMDSIYQAGTWTLVPLPSGRSAIGCKWVFKLKLKADNSIDRYKARLVAKGFSQIEELTTLIRSRLWLSSALLEHC
jgi:Reverse transcriptase (RNA-dependent DNA polymerase)